MGTSVKHIEHYEMASQRASKWLTVTQLTLEVDQRQPTLGIDK